MKRVVLIANKSWEVDPILSALLNEKIRSKELSNPDIQNFPWRYPAGTAVPRAVWNSFKNITIELWCIQDVMDAHWHSSSSEGKNKCLPKVFKFRPDSPDLVVALGTSAYGSKTDNNNGCVTIGTNIFVHNFHPNGENTKSRWDDPVNFEKLIQSPLDPGFFQLWDANTIKSIEERLLNPPLNPSSNIRVISDFSFLGLSSVNVTDPNEYEGADQAGMEAIADAGIKLSIASVETTHAIIRLQSNAPFLFMSGIANRIGKYPEDVNGSDPQGNKKKEAQNFSAAFNVGACLGHILPKITRYFQEVVSN